jgi:hypothetical protein
MQRSGIRSCEKDNDELQGAIPRALISPARLHLSHGGSV